MSSPEWRPPLPWAWGVARRAAIATRAAFLLAGLLAGCNFHPMYAGSGGQALRQDLGMVEVAPIGDRSGQALRNALIDQIDPTGDGERKTYVLDVDVDTAQNALLIQLDDTVTRYDLSLAATFSLKRKGDGVVVYRSAVRRTASYNVRNEPYATLVAKQDAQRRAAVEASNEIAARLALFFRQQQS